MGVDNQQDFYHYVKSNFVMKDIYVEKCLILINPVYKVSTLF